MKLQLLTLIAIVATATALPKPGATDTYEKRDDVKLECNSPGQQKCFFLDVSGRKIAGSCQDVSLVLPAEIGCRERTIWVDD